MARQAVCGPSRDCFPPLPISLPVLSLLLSYDWPRTAAHIAAVMRVSEADWLRGLYE